MAAREAPRAVQDCHEILQWMIPLLDQFPPTDVVEFFVSWV